MAQICVRPGCGRAARREAVSDPMTLYCPDCGSRMQLMSEPTGGSMAAAPALAAPPIEALAPKVLRIGAYFVDFLIALLLGVLALIPVVGQSIGGFLLICFWLFRDINGASPGKMATGLTIVNRTGGPSTVKQRIMRNLPFAIAIAPLIVPFVGYPVAAVMQLCAMVMEIVMVLLTGERLTDRLVGTKVVKRAY